MKINRLGTFTLGVIVTVVSVGAVSFVNAADDATIKACANKKTGAMRYISKGKCKNTESSLSWNQMGPQGMPGATGANGTNGATGATGQNLYLVDSQDRQFGLVLGTQNSGNQVDFLYEGGIWTWARGGGLTGSIGQVNFYSDSNCTSHLYSSGDGWFQSTDRGWNYDGVSPRYFKPTGNRIDTSITPVYGKVRSGVSPNFVYTCTISSDPSFVNWFKPQNTDDILPLYLTAVVEVAPPTLVGPVRIVQR